MDQRRDERQPQGHDGKGDDGLGGLRVGVGKPRERQEDGAHGR